MPRRAAFGVRRGGEGQRMGHAIGSQQQTRHQIAGEERRIGGSGHNALGPLFGGPVEPSKHPRQRPGEAFDTIGQHREA